MRDVRNQYLEYTREGCKADERKTTMMNFEEDVNILVAVMREHYGSNLAHIARSSQGFNDFSALPILLRETGTQRFLDAWGTTGTWVKDVLAGPNKGHLFMDQPSFQDFEEEGLDDDDEGDPVALDVELAARVQGSSNESWVVNAVRGWDRSHRDVEGSMGEDQQAQARTLLTRHASRIKVLCKTRHEQMLRELAEQEAQKERDEAARARELEAARQYEKQDFEVLAIRGKRVHPIHGLQYEVHWKGHSRGESTWEIARYVKQAARKIAEFEARSEKWHRTHKTRNNLEHAVSSAEESPESGSDDNEPLRIACNRGMKRPRTSK